MDEDLKQESELNVTAQLQKIQQHLVYLEKKIDTLIAQSQSHPSSGGGGNAFPRRHFSKPRPSFDRGHSHGQGPSRHEHRPQREDNRPPRPFDRPARPEQRGFFHKKKRFSRREKG